MRYFLFLFTSLFLLAASCTKEEYDPLAELPPATQEGRYKMGCLIDGAPWKNRGGDVFNPSISGSYGSTPPRVNVVGYDLNPSDSTILYEKLVLRINPLQIGDVPIHDSVAEYEWISSTNPKVYRIDTIVPANITVTFHDLNSRILAGTFSFTLVDEDGSERLEITDGRFDVIYQ